MSTAWMYATSSDGERWILQGLRTWGLSITRALRRAGDEPPRIGTLLDRAYSRSGVFCQAAEALWLRSLGSHDTRPLLSALRRLAEAAVALTGPKAKITGVIPQIDEQWQDVSIRDVIGGQDLLPEEFIYRFGAILELAHPTADELRERVAAMHAELGIGADPGAVARRLLRSGKGMRALEEYLTGLLLIPPHAT